MNRTGVTRALVDFSMSLVGRFRGGLGHVTKCGGIDRSQKIAAICAAAGIPCYVGGCIETHPGVAASVHFYAATPNIVSAAELRAESAYVDDVVAAPLAEVGGAIALPREPGLGVAVDEEKVARYRASF